MTTSTQAMNNVSKVQAQSTANKMKQGDTAQLDVNFNELFSSAMGQMAPNAQLNSIESQLRESLFKQDSKSNRKNSESNSNAEAAQAAVWAQRDWMQQQAKVPQADVSAPPAASTGNNTKAAEPASAAKTEKNDTPVRNANSSQTNSQANSEASGEAKAAGQVESPANASLPADQAAPATPTAQAAAPQAAANSTISQPSANQPSAMAGEPNGLAAEQIIVEQTVQPNTQAVRPDDKSTAQAKADTALDNSTVQVKFEQAGNASGNGTAATGNAQTLAAQLAPQIAQQTSMQGELAESEGLKVGQKILATGSLQTAGTSQGIAAGTNGLNGTLGNAQQALIKTPVNQPGFAKEIGQTVQWAIGNNLSTVDIRVNPESFGPMNMRLVQKGQQVQLVIRTQDEASANLLTQALGGLKEVLAQNGLQLNQVQIQHGNANTPNGQGNQSQAQFDQQGNGQGRSGQQSGKGESTELDNAVHNAAPAAARKAEGKLDLFA